MDDLEKAKILLEGRSLEDEANFAVDTAKEINKTKEKLSDFLSGIIAATVSGAVLFDPNADRLDGIKYKVNNYTVIFKESWREESTWYPNLILKHKGKKLLDLTFTNYNNKSETRKIWKIDYSRFNLILNFTRELKKKSDEIKMRV